MALATMRSRRGATSQNATVEPDFDFAMLSTDGREQAADDGVVADAKPASVALVPTVQSAQWSQAGRPLPRPNSIFVTHLIATAEQLPQTRGLRRATPADAQTAYRAHQHPVRGAGIRTRQTI
jgi:hypothetical protein